MTVALKPWLWRLTIFALTLLLCLSLFRDDVSRSLFSSSGTNDPNTCSISRSLARSLHLQTPVSYTRLRIDVAEAETGHAFNNTSDNVSKKLGSDMPAMHPLRRTWTFNLAAADGGSCTTSTTLQLPRPPSTPPNAANIVFGVATHLTRLEDSLQAFSHWAGNTAITIYALVNRERITDRDTARVTRKAADLGVKLDIARQNLSGPPHSTIGDRYFAMIKHVHERINQQEQAIQWAGFIDDDTFFPSTRALLRFLDAYNASQPHYIGGLSEDVVLLDLIGRMAYGGAGIFLSLPMLAQVYEHWDDCNDHHIVQGDKRLRSCILAHTPSELEVEEKLHQVSGRQGYSPSHRHKSGIANCETQTD